MLRHKRAWKHHHSDIYAVLPEHEKACLNSVALMLHLISDLQNGAVLLWSKRPEGFPEREKSLICKTQETDIIEREAIKSRQDPNNF